MPLNFTADQLAKAREQEKAINGMGDREYIIAVCDVISRALQSSTTRNLDLSEIRTLVDQMQEQIEDKIYAQADKLEAPEEPEEPGLEDNDLDDLDLGESTETDEDSKQFTLQEATEILLKSGYNID